MIDHMDPETGRFRIKLGQTGITLTQPALDDLVGDREVTNGETVDWRTMEPIKGGLASPETTGGHGGPSEGGNGWHP